MLNLPLSCISCPVWANIPFQSQVWQLSPSLLRHSDITSSYLSLNQLWNYYEHITGLTTLAISSKALGYNLQSLTWIQLCIRIHHECSCRIWKSHLRGRNFNQGRAFKPTEALLSPWLKFRHQGWDFTILHELAHDRLLLSHFSGNFDRIYTTQTINFLCIVFMQNLTLLWLSVPKTGVNLVCTFKIAGKRRFEHWF